MTMTQTNLFSLGASPPAHHPSTLDLLDLDLAFPMTVGAGFVDPRLVEPIADDPDIEDLIAFRTSTI
jgi:hypothetical protein